MCVYLRMAGQMMQVWFGSFLFANNITLIFFSYIIKIFLNNIKKLLLMKLLIIALFLYYFVYDNIIVMYYIVL